MNEKDEKKEEGIHLELCLNLNTNLSKHVIPSITEFIRCAWCMRKDLKLGVTVSFVFTPRNVERFSISGKS